MLPEIPYLLIEDEDTLGFKPFEDQHDQSQNSRYYDQDTGLAKPSFSQHGVERCHPNQEMLGRIRDFLAEGMRLAVDTVCLARTCKHQGNAYCLITGH